MAVAAAVSFAAIAGRGRGSGVRAGRVGTDPVVSGALVSRWPCVAGAGGCGAAVVRAVRGSGGVGSLSSGDGCGGGIAACCGGATGTSPRGRTGW